MTLSEWISENKITAAEAARRFGVAHTTVARWCSGELFPGRTKLIVIRDRTGGKVGPADFTLISERPQQIETQAPTGAVV